MSPDPTPPIPRTNDRRRRPSWLARAAGAGVLLVIAAVVGRSLVRPSATPDGLWAEAETSLRAGRVAEARAAVGRLGQLRDPTPLDWFLRGQVALAEGRADDALLALAKVPDDHAMAPQARLLAGQVELRRHRARIAERLLREAIRLDPGLVQAHRELIYILGYQLRRVELNAEFEALARLADLSFDNVFHWCLLRVAQWEPATAIDELAAFLEADPDDRWSRLALAENERRAGRGRDAEEVLAPLPADDPEATACRVMLLMDQHRQDEAERLLGGVPADVPAVARLLGRIALARRDGAAAARHFQAAEAREPGHRESVFGLVNARTLLGDEAAAGPYRQRGRRIDELNSLLERASAHGSDRDAALLRKLGAACAELGRYPEARAWYKLALAVEPLDAETQQALYRLRSREHDGATSARGTDDRG